MRRDGGATLVEVSIALAVAVMLALGVWELFLSGRRGMARGEAKLDYMADANTAFLTLERDLHASIVEPEVVSDRVLVVRRFQVSQASSAVGTQSISYARTEGPDPRDTALERRITTGALPDEDRERRLCRGTLSDFHVAVRAVNGCRAVEVTLAFRGVQDNGETRFRRLFTARNATPDETWVPVKK